MDRVQKINFLTVPVSLGLIGIITMILVLTEQAWMYYLIGGLTGMMCHSLMVKQNARMIRYAKLDPEQKVFKPKKSAILWLLLRFALLIAIFGALIYLARIQDDKYNIIPVICALGGYLTAKVGFVVCLIVIKDKKPVLDSVSQILEEEEEKEVDNE